MQILVQTKGVTSDTGIVVRVVSDTYTAIHSYAIMEKSEIRQLLVLQLDSPHGLDELVEQVDRL